jgi:hypothetical protein
MDHFMPTKIISETTPFSTIASKNHPPSATFQTASRTATSPRHAPHFTAALVAQQDDNAWSFK